MYLCFVLLLTDPQVTYRASFLFGRDDDDGGDEVRVYI